MRLFKSFSKKTAIESVNPQTAAILMSSGFSGNKRVNQQQTK